MPPLERIWSVLRIRRKIVFELILKEIGVGVQECRLEVLEDVLLC